MPLIVLCGYPCCGKTTFANRLADYLKEHANITAIVANEETLLLNKKTAYQDTTKEKLTRGVLKSYVDQKLNSKSVVILDSLNYIKGFRYELHCMARELRSSHCVVWVRSNEKVAAAWNKARPEEDRYDESLFYELRQRFEAPNASNRWDFPLFHVDMTPAQIDDAVLAVASSISDSLTVSPAAAAVEPPPVPDVTTAAPQPEVKKPSSFRRAPRKKPVASSDAESMSVEKPVPTANVTVPPPVPPVTAVDPKHQKLTFSGSVREDAGDASSPSGGVGEGISAIDTTPEHCCELLRTFIKTAAAPTANPATVATPHLKANMLYLLDKISQDVVTAIVRHQNNAANATDPLLFTEFDRVLELFRIVSLAELQRHRRQFVKVNSQIPPSNQLDIGASFIEFLALQL